MKTNGMWLLAGVLALVLGPSMAAGGIITLGSDSLTDILGPTVEPASTLNTTVMDSGNLKVTVLSQAYTNGSGLYAYLYQIVNTGVAGNSPAQQFTLWPMFDATDSTDIGLLSGTIPTEFATDGQEPKASAYVLPLTGGAQISFYFGLLDGKSIDPGEHSVVMYCASSYAPDEVWGSVIDGGATGNGQITGPAPEPGTMVLLALGAVGLLRRRMR